MSCKGHRVSADLVAEEEAVAAVAGKRCQDDRVGKRGHCQTRQHPTASSGVAASDAAGPVREWTPLAPHQAPACHSAAEKDVRS